MVDVNLERFESLIIRIGFSEFPAVFGVVEVSVRGACVDLTVLLRCITPRYFRGWWDCSWGMTRSGRMGSYTLQWRISHITLDSPWDEI